MVLANPRPTGCSMKDEPGIMTTSG